MNCRRCGIAVTSGLRLCERCALAYGDGPKFSLDIGPKQRPLYEQQPTPPQGDTDGNDP